MQKLRLNVDALVVETFETDAARGAGTVAGAQFVDFANDSGGSDCPNCWSAEPCTGIPIETCTCGCDAGPVTGPVKEPTRPEPVPHTGCAATSVCTCTPIETCSCAPGYF